VKYSTQLIIPFQYCSVRLHNSVWLKLSIGLLIIRATARSNLTHWTPPARCWIAESMNAMYVLQHFFYFHVYCIWL